MAEAPDKLDLILSAIGAMAERMETLTERMTAVEAGYAAPADPSFVPFTMSQDTGFAPLVPLNDDNELARYKLCKMLGILHSEQGEELMAHGARGYIRRLERHEGQDRLDLPYPVLVALVEDALSECPIEAADMGNSLLKNWEMGEYGDELRKVRVLAT
jgi:hypothetical protein